MPDTVTPLTIPTRFNGPPASGNGGYVGGLLAERLGQPRFTWGSRSLPANTGLIDARDYVPLLAFARS